MKDINSYRRKQQRNGKCFCPKKALMACDMDCYGCKYRTFANDPLSLDEIISTKDGDSSYSREMCLQDATNKLVEERVFMTACLKMLKEELEQFGPEYRDLFSLLLDGFSVSDCAKMLKIPNSTLDRKIKNAFAAVQKKCRIEKNFKKNGKNDADMSIS